MAPSIIYNDAALREVFLPGQIFVFGGFALRPNSLGHLEQIDSYTQVTILVLEIWIISLVSEAT